MHTQKLCEKIDSISKQFLCNVPTMKFIWHDIFEYLTYDLQEVLLNKTINCYLVLNYQIETNYQKTFLKHIIENLEEQNSEVHDELYSAYGRLVALPPKNEYYKHYWLGECQKTISLKENVNLISDGTTGLRTWQAALVLSEWSLSNTETFRNKSVLELGSGMGLTGLTIASECSPTSMFLTDCHSSVLKTLRENVKLNISNDAANSDGENSLDVSHHSKLFEDRCVYSSLGKPNVFVLNLPWEEVNKQSCTKLGTINKVIAADVVYDSELFDPLITALKSLSSVCSVDEFIFSCTERNQETLEEFLSLIRKDCFKVEELEVPLQKHFIWPTDTPVRLFRFIVSTLK